MTVISKKSTPPPPRGSQYGNPFVLVLVVLAFLGWSLYFALPQHALDTSGRRTTGTLTDMYSGSKGAKYVEYRYQVGNQTFSDRCNVRDGDFHRDQIGGPVTVVYLPNRPGVSRTEPSNSAFAAYFFFWAVVIGGSVSFVLVGIDFLQRRSR